MNKSISYATMQRNTIKYMMGYINEYEQVRRKEHGFQIKDLILSYASLGNDTSIGSVIKGLSSAKANFGAIKPWDLLDLINKKGAYIIKDLAEVNANFGAIKPWDLVKLIVSFSGHNHPEEWHMHNMNMHKCTDVIEHLSYTNATFELNDRMVAKLVEKCGINIVESLESVGVKINDAIVEELSNKKINEIFGTQDADFTTGEPSSVDSLSHCMAADSTASYEIAAHYC